MEPLPSTTQPNISLDVMAHSNTFLFLLFLQIPLSCIGIRAEPPTKVPAIIVFGDSSVDAGNNNQIRTVLKSNFEPYGRDFWDARPTGRFSNGRIAPDFISEAFGIKPAVPAYLDPTYSIKDFADGVCFASAGTGYDNATSNVLNVIPLWQELVHFKEYQTKLRSYVGDQKATYILTEALYLISVGTNDFLENYYTIPGRRSQFTINGYQHFLVGIAESFVKAIYDLGGRKISVGGIPPMGCLPLERTMNFIQGSDCREDYNEVARDFNGKLQALVAKLNQELVGIRLVYSDVYDTLLELVQKPYLYGFENVAVGCCATGMFEMGYLCDKWNPFTCADASKYVFWDSFHGTEKMNKILADHVMATSLAQFV